MFAVAPVRAARGDDEDEGGTATTTLATDTSWPRDASFLFVTASVGDERAATTGLMPPPGVVLNDDDLTSVSSLRVEGDGGDASDIDTSSMLPKTLPEPLPCGFERRSDCRFTASDICALAFRPLPSAFNPAALSGSPPPGDVIDEIRPSPPVERDVEESLSAALVMAMNRFAAEPAVGGRAGGGGIYDDSSVGCVCVEGETSPTDVRR